MKRFLALTFALLALPQMVLAADFTEKYVDVDLKTLTEFAEHHKAINLNSPDAFAEYLKITDCATYLSMQNSQFRQHEQKQILEAKKQAQNEPDKDLFFRIPITFYTSGYNFDTQALDVVPRWQLNRVNVLELVPIKSSVCDGTTSVSVLNIPAIYVAKLNFPVSLRRIPLQKNIAESISTKMLSHPANANWKTLYGYMFVQIDAIQPEINRAQRFIRATVRGQVNAIDLYLDEDRTIQVKRLNYGDAF